MFKVFLCKHVVCSVCTTARPETVGVEFVPAQLTVAAPQSPIAADPIQIRDSGSKKPQIVLVDASVAACESLLSSISISSPRSRTKLHGANFPRLLCIILKAIVVCAVHRCADYGVFLTLTTFQNLLLNIGPAHSALTSSNTYNSS